VVCRVRLAALFTSSEQSRNRTLVLRTLTMRINPFILEPHIKFIGEKLRDREIKGNYIPTEIRYKTSILQFKAQEQ
jgi:hypothetical protein